MAFPRISAVILVVLLTASLSLLCVGVITLHKPVGSKGAYVVGEIVAVESNMDFVLEIADGQQLRFHCGSLCRTSLQHLLRHFHEHATTYVYYVQGPHKSLLALDVD